MESTLYVINLITYPNPQIKYYKLYTDWLNYTA